MFCDLCVLQNTADAHYFLFSFPFMPLWRWERCSECMSSVITDFCVVFPEDRDTRPNHYTNETMGVFALGKPGRD